MVNLRSERLILREFVADDWPALHEIESRSEVAQYQSFEPRTSEQSREYVLGASKAVETDPRATYDLAVIEVKGGRLIGRCGFGISDAGQQQAMLWYTLHPDHWGRGYTTEAARTLVDFGFGELGLHRIWADCDPANTGSWRVLEKIGMRKEAHLVENTWFKGAWADSLIYAVLAREWGKGA
jgi:RimJ/RimL family protein N-acetyltransferase